MVFGVELATDSFDEIKRALDAWPKHVEEVIKNTAGVVSTLARLGWFLPAPSQLRAREMKAVRSLRGKNNEEVEKFMCDLYEERLSIIHNSLCTRFPHRSEIIDQAFKAHIDELYALSVPVFLSQADGIFLELSGMEKGVFSRRSGVPFSKSFIDKMGLDEFMQIFLQPLCSTTALNANEEERLVNPFILNRHEVMHGLSTNYGNKTNSLKAISFLFFIPTNIEDALRSLTEDDLDVGNSEVHGTRIENLDT